MTDNNRYTKAEFLIYKYTDEGLIQIRLLDDPELDIAVNMDSHGLNHDELVALLFKLFEDHLLVAFENKKNYFTPTLVEIENALKQPPREDENYDYNNEVFYGTTSCTIDRRNILKEIYGNKC